MALIKCEECGKEISDTVNTCVHCGFKIKKNSKPKNKKTKQKKNISLKWVILVIASVGIAFITLLIISRTKITLIKSLEIQINSKVQLLSLVKDISNGKIVSKDETVDTSKLGKKEITFDYTNNIKKEKKYTFKIVIVDTEKPVIEFQNEITSTAGNELNLLENAKVVDNSKETIIPIIEGTYDFQKEGNYELKYIATDSSNNSTEEKFALKVIAATVKIGGRYTWKSNGIVVLYEFKNDNKIQMISGYENSSGEMLLGTYKIVANKMTATFTEICYDVCENKDKPFVTELKITNVDTLESIDGEQRIYNYES